MEKRKVADCRKMPGGSDCTIAIAGSEEEVVPLAVYHAITSHGHDDTPETEKLVRDSLEDEQ